MIGAVVKRADEQRTTIDQLSLEELRSIDARFGDDARDVFDFARSAESRDADGGTSKRAVLKQIGQMLEAVGAAPQD